MWVNPQFYANMLTFAKETLNGKVYFWALIRASTQKIAVKKKITYFLKNHIASLFTIFEKIPCNLHIFLPLGI